MKKANFFLVLFISIILQMGYSQNQVVIDSIEKVMHQSVDPNQRVMLLLMASKEYLKSQPNKAKMYAENAFSLSEKNDFKKGQVLALLDLASISLTKADLKSSIEYAIQAKEFSSINGFQNDYANSLIIAANGYAFLGDFKKSSDLCYEALGVFEQTKDSIGIADALNGIGNNYYAQDQSENALKFFEQALHISEQIHYIKGISRGLNNTVIIYAEDENRIPECIEVMRKAINLNIETGQPLELGDNFLNMAQYFWEMNNTDSSFYYLYKAIDNFGEFENMRGLSSSYIKLSEHYSELGNEDEFFRNISIADSITQRNDFKDKRYIVSEALQNYYSSKGQFDSAFHYSIIRFDLKNSLDIEKSLTRLAQLELLYEQDKIEQEKRNQQAREKLINILIFISLGAIIIFILLLLFRFRLKVRYSKLKQQKLEDELDFRKREMATNVMALMKKNEMLSDITIQLIDIEKKAAKEETKTSIRKVAREIEKSTQEKIWEEFELRFKQVHPDFYAKLTKLYPDLSANELRLAAFLKLNLSTKDISSMTGQSIRSLEMARYRLRKKIGIAATDTNLTSLIANI